MPFQNVGQIPIFKEVSNKTSLKVEEHKYIYNAEIKFDQKKNHLKMGEKSHIPKMLVIANSVKTMKPISFFFHYRMRIWYLGN